MVPPMKTFFLLLVLFLTSTLAVMAHSQDGAHDHQDRVAESSTTVEVDSESTNSPSFAAIPEPSITLLVAAGSFVYLLRWRGGRKR